MDRKSFLKTFTVASGLLTTGMGWSKPRQSNNTQLKPAKVSVGDVAAIVSPAGAVVSDSDIDDAIAAVRRLGFIPKIGKNLGARWGYLGGRDTERLQDLHEAFADPTVKVVFPIRGGYGTSRLLPMLDFEMISRNPKAFVGFSDNTSLVLSMNQFSNLVTFYGPNALYDWTPYTQENLRRVIMSNSPAGIFPFPTESPEVSHLPAFPIVKGKAEGELVGGNLSLLIQTLGTEWEIDTRGKILFFEDVNESPYRIDRMLTHLWLAKKLQVAAGFAIGQITETKPSDGLDVREVLKDRFGPLGKPCYVGFSTGHIPNILTLPLGVRVELDSVNGVLRATESAVV